MKERMKNKYEREETPWIYSGFYNKMKLKNGV